MSYQTALSFEAKPMATYTVLQKPVGKKEKASEEILTIYELEKKDLPALQTLKKKADEHKLFPKQEKRLYQNPTFSILQQGLKDLTEFFDRLRFSKEETKPPTIGLLGVIDNKPVGLLMGNDPYGNHFSINEADREAELNYLVTWSNTPNHVLKGVGFALMSEFSRFCEETGLFESIYLDSTTDGKKTYKKFGFKDHKEAESGFNIPMAISLPKALDKAQSNAKTGHREALSGESVPLGRFLDLKDSYDLSRLVTEEKQKIGANTKSYLQHERVLSKDDPLNRASLSWKEFFNQINKKN